MRDSLKMILLAGACFAAIPANAQDYRQDYRHVPRGYAYTNGPEEVIVQAPRWYEKQRGSFNAPIRNVSLSEPVRFDDLDLRSDRDVRRLQARIQERATVLCRRLDVRYPVTVNSGSHNCYRDAVADAMGQVEVAVAQQRGYGADYAPRQDVYDNPPPPYPYSEDDNDNY
jgi:UrcA family protein